MDEELIKRVMPHSLEAEQSVIGCMIMDSDAIVTAAGMLERDDFYHQQYGILFETIVELYNSGAAVDMVTLQNRLRQKNVPPEISSLEYVGDLVASVSTSANAPDYAAIVKEKSILRKLIRTTESIADECYLGQEGLNEILDDTEKRIFNLLQTNAGNEYVPIRELVLDALTRIENAAKIKSTVTGLPTGFPDLDFLLAGLQKSDLILVAARPSMGRPRWP